MSICMWRAMANVRCLCPPTWKNLELADLTRLADQRAPQILPLLPLQCWDCMGVASYMSRFLHGSWGSKLRSSYLCGKHFIDWDIPHNNKIQCISGAQDIKGQHREVRLITQILFSAQSWIVQTTLLLAPQCQRLAQSDLSETLWRWEATGGDGIWSILFFLQFLLFCQWHTFTPWKQQGQLSSLGHQLASIPSSESLQGSMSFWVSQIPWSWVLVLSCHHYLQGSTKERPVLEMFAIDSQWQRCLHQCIH